MKAMFGSIIGTLGLQRLPEGTGLVAEPLAPDVADGPEGAYFPSPPLAKDWRENARKGVVPFRKLMDPGSPEGRLLYAAYPDIGDIPVRFDPSGDSNWYLRPGARAADGRTYPEQASIAGSADTIDEEDVRAGLVHEILTHAVATREGWPEEFRGTSEQAAGTRGRYMDNPGERLAQAHVMYEANPGMRANVRLPRLVEALVGRPSGASTRTLPPPLEPKTILDELPIQMAAKGGEGEDRFAMSRNFLATDEVPESIFGIPVVQDEDAWTEADLEFFRKHPEAGGYYDMGGETPEDGSAEGAPTQADEAGDTSQHGGLTVQQKLERADELLKRWEGTDRYDEFKKRVDEMHAKYGQPAQQPAQQPGTSYLQKTEKATPWVKQGINTLYNIAAGGGGTDMGISQVLDTVHDTYQSASQSVIQAGRNKIAKFVADAGKQAAAGVGEGTLKEAGFAREVAADLGRKGDLVLKQTGEGATEQAANLYKGANDMKKTASGLEETARAAKATASRQARVKAMNHVIDTGYQQTLKTAARKAGVKAATKVGVQLGAKAVASSVGPAAIAAGAVESAVRQGADLADTMKNTGATWSDVGKATGDVFTTKQGWKNLGWGLLGSLKDVASSVTLGAVDNGDKLRERMMDAKGGEARGRYPGSLNNPGNVERRAERRRGEVASPHRRWARFATPQDGLREMADAIRQIADVKLAGKGQPFTIRNFAETYAPRFNGKGEPENDTDRYVRDISSTSGIGADAVLDRRNAGDMAKLLKTIVRFESGVPHSEWFTDDEYRTAARELGEGSGRPTGTKTAPSLPAKARSASGGSTRSKGDR